MSKRTNQENIRVNTCSRLLYCGDDQWMDSGGTKTTATNLGFGEMDSATAEVFGIHDYVGEDSSGLPDNDDVLPSDDGFVRRFNPYVEKTRPPNLGFSEMDSNTQWLFAPDQNTRDSGIATENYHAESLEGWGLNLRKQIMQVFVRTVRGNTVTCNVNESSNVGDLEKAVFLKSGTHANDQYLMYQGKPLTCKTTLLSDYGIQSRCSVQTMGRLRGG